MEFAAQISHLREILAFIKAAAERAGFDGSLCQKIELACEEALVNIIQHAYAGKQSGAIEVQCVSPRRRELHIILKDHGSPFNPLAHESMVDTAASLDSREPGGLGLYFIRQLMSEVHYRRDDDGNVLTLVMREE